MKNECPINKIVKRNGSIVAYDRTRISTAILKATASAGTPNPDLAEDLAGKVETALFGAYGSDRMPSVEDIQDVVESVLIENHLGRVAKNYIIYRHQHAVARAARAYRFDVTDNVPYKKIYEVLRWNVEHGCESVDALNRAIRSGRFPELVRESDNRYADEIKLAASKIVEQRSNVRLVIVAGPSASGKTTTTIKAQEELGKHGIRLKAINLDNYFFDLEKHPRDEFGDYDYETPQALDLGMVNEHLARILAGEKIKTPHYDFKKGTRTLGVHNMALGKDEMLLMDSLHGLYDATTAAVPAEKKFRLYVETLGQFRTADGPLMRWSDNRLLRRMIRDKSHRNLMPKQTLTHWHYVRRSELNHIIPYIKKADCIVNSSLVYELPILKPKLFSEISAAARAYKDDPQRLDAWIRANRMYSLLKPILPVRDTRCVPPDSLLREFIGGSRYKY